MVSSIIIPHGSVRLLFTSCSFCFNCSQVWRILFLYYAASACNSIWLICSTSYHRVHATFVPNFPPLQVIRREAADAASEAESWARELRRELEDARDEHEASADAREGRGRFNRHFGI